MRSHLHVDMNYVYRMVTTFDDSGYATEIYFGDQQKQIVKSTRAAPGLSSTQIVIMSRQNTTEKDRLLHFTPINQYRVAKLN